MGDDKQTVLIVVGNPMTETSLRSHFERRGWQATVCDDGDKAVDEYVASKPDLVLLSLDISGLDGHIAADPRNTLQRENSIRFHQIWEGTG